MFEMHHYVTITKDGLYHVQNAVGGMFGQHHVHTKEGFEMWAKHVKGAFVHIVKGTCDCGLQDGFVRDHTGNVTFRKSP